MSESGESKEAIRGPDSGSGNKREIMRRLVDSFLPADIAPSVETVRRARLTVMTAWAIVVVALPLAVVDAVTRAAIDPSVLAFFIGVPLMGLNPYLLRITGAQRVVASLVCLELLGALAVMSYYSAGIDSAAMLWNLPVPLIAQLLLGPVGALAFGGLALIVMLVFYEMAAAGFVFPQQSPPELELWWQTAGLVSTTAFIAMLGWFFALEFQRAEAAAVRGDQQRRAIIAATPIALFAVDKQGCLTLFEGHGLRTWRTVPGDLLGESMFDLYASVEGVGDNLRRALGGEVVRFVAEVQGKVFDVSARPTQDEHGHPSGAFGVALDITERREMEARLAVSDRMSSMGMLAAGVAHEINNPLTYVITNLEYASQELEAGEGQSSSDAGELREVLDEATEGAVRVAAIVRDMKLFSRADTDELTTFSLESVVSSTLNMAKNEIRHRAQLDLEIDPSLRVTANESRFGQVVLNLVMNAAQAIPLGTASANRIGVVGKRDREGRVVLEVSDTGCGIEPSATGRIFEPFYTTKEMGGTGLGLSICQRIVNESGGTISVESTLGEGTCFRVVLPGADAPAPTEESAPGPPASDRVARVLVIDDEELVGRAIKRVLRECDVTLALNASEGLALCEANQYDLILCDVMMPELSGMEVYERLRALDQNLTEQVVFMTGGVSNTKVQRFLDGLPNPYLGKPLERSVLMDLVRRRLEATGS